MSTITNPKTAWEKYCAEELSLIVPILNDAGFTLQNEQPHIQGERYLMQAVTTTSGKKLILLGRDNHGKKVVIKATRDGAGKKELTHERLCREILKRIDFAGDVFHTPTERAFIVESGYTISIQDFIEQELTFLERPTPEQFAFALQAFKGQESAHATTFKHRKLISGVFEIRDAKSYLKNFASFQEKVHTTLKNTDIDVLLQEACTTLTAEEKTIEQYTGFLTHTDFVPHNIRIANNTIYLLDHSSLTFGNKYEGWARFLNFMTLYNPALEKALLQYVHDNRTQEESVALRMMRIYRLGEIIWYYVQTLEKSDGNLLALNTLRIHFWKEVLISVLSGKELSESIREDYKTKRDSLRSDDEMNRQKDLH